MARKRIGEMLVEAGLLDAVGLWRALNEQRRWGGQLGSVLVDLKLVSEDALVAALSRQLNFPVVRLDDIDVAEEVLALVPSELAERHQIVPFAREGKFFDVAMSDPTNLGIIDELRIRTQLNVRTYLAGPKSIERGLARFYGAATGHLGLSFRPRDMRDEDFDIDVEELEDKTATIRSRERDQEILALQDRLSTLEALVSRDEDVIRKLLGLLIDKGVASREEVLDRIK